MNVIIARYTRRLEIVGQMAYFHITDIPWVFKYQNFDLDSLKTLTNRIAVLPNMNGNINSL